MTPDEIIEARAERDSEEAHRKIEERRAMTDRDIRNALRIRDEVLRRDVLRDELCTAHETTIQAINAEIQELRGECQHPHPAYHPDASGNNDSEEECLFCGMRAKDLAKHRIHRKEPHDA